MKKTLLVLAIAATAVSFNACGNKNGNGGSGNSDSASGNMTKIPDNSSATNPSLADTAYSNDSTSMKKDSIKKK